MKILVPIKRVVDYNVKVRPLSDNSNVDLNNVKMAVNPFCEIALEEAVKIKEAGQASEVIAVSVGKLETQEQLRTALALGWSNTFLTSIAFDDIVLDLYNDACSVVLLEVTSADPSKAPCVNSAIIGLLVKSFVGFDALVIHFSPPLTWPTVLNEGKFETKFCILAVAIVPL